jgi:hypothetical protein
LRGGGGGAVIGGFNRVEWQEKLGKMAGFIVEKKTKWIPRNQLPLKK